MSGAKSYPSLRHSGIWWIGDLPSHWRCGKTKRFAALRSGHTPSRSNLAYWTNCHIPWFSLADVWQLRDGRQIYLGDTAEKISDLGLANSAADLLPVGTVVLSRTASVGFSGIMPRPMATTQDFVNWIPGPELTSKYLLYVFRSMGAVFESLKTGSTHKTIYVPDVLSFSTPLPPLEEQTQIARFLDYETAKIDRLIEKQQQLIALLKEKRQAVISHAVTKGLNPEAPMKDSGVEWLGQVPAHWEVVPIKWLVTRLQTGSTPPTEQVRYYEDGSLPWYGPSSFGEPFSIGEPVKLVHDSAVREGKVRVFQAWTVLVVGIGATIGKSALATVQCSANQQVTALEFAPSKLDSVYAGLAVRRMERVFRDRAQYTTMPIMNQKEIGEYFLPVPPLHEQREIAAHSVRQANRIDELVLIAQRAAEILQERRAALISAAVTGKIDVRNWQPPALATETQDPE